MLTVPTYGGTVLDLIGLVLIYGLRVDTVGFLTFFGLARIFLL